MFQAIAYVPNGHKSFCPNNLKIGGFKTEKAAKRALLKQKHKGVVTKYGAGIVFKKD